MASNKITRWTHGINTRVNKFRINDTEAVDAVDVDFSTIELKPDNGLLNDVGAQPPGEYNFKSSWVPKSGDTADSTKYTESGDYLIKSYSSSVSPKFNRRTYDSAGDDSGCADEMVLGVPAKPLSGPSVAVATAGSEGDSLAYSNILNEAFGTSVSDCNPDNGDLTLVHENETSGFDLIKEYSNILVLINTTSGLIRRRQLNDGGTGGINDVTLTKKDVIFIHGKYIVGIDSDRSNVEVVYYNSATKSSVAIPDPTTGGFFSTYGFSQEQARGSNPHGGYSVGQKPGWNLNGWQLHPSNSAHSYSISDGTLYISRNFTSNYQTASLPAQFYTLTTPDHGLTAYGSGTAAGMAFTNYGARHNHYNVTSGTVYPRYEIEHFSAKPSNTHPKYTSSGSDYNYPTVGSNVDADELWNHMILLLVPGEGPTIATTTEDSNGDEIGNGGSGAEDETTYTNIVDYLGDLKYEVVRSGSTPNGSAYPGNTGTGPYKINDLSPASMWGGGGTVSTGCFAPLFRALPITLGSEDYVAILIAGAVWRVGSGGARQHAFSHNSTTGAFSVLYTGHSTAYDRWHWKATSFQKHYEVERDVGQNYTYESDDGKWYWAQDGTKQVYSYYIDHTHKADPDDVSVGSIDLRKYWYNNDFFSSSIGTEYGPDLSVSGTGNSAQLLVKAYDGDDSAMEVRFGLKLPSAEISYWNTNNLQTIGRRESTWIVGSADSITHNDRWNLISVNTKIPLSSTNTASTEVTGVKSIAITDGPKKIFNDKIKVARKHAVPNVSIQNDSALVHRTNILINREETTWNTTPSNSNWSDFQTSGYTSYLTRTVLASTSDLDVSGTQTYSEFTTDSTALQTMGTKFKSFKSNGGEAADIIMFNSTGNSWECRYNSRTSSNPFSTIAATVTLTTHDKVKQNVNSSLSVQDSKVVFLNSGGTGETIQILDFTNNFSVGTGSNEYSGISNVKDMWFDGYYRIFRTATNKCVVYVLNNKNQFGLFSLPFHSFGYLVNGYFHGVTDSSGSVDDYYKAFVFFDYEIDDLEDTSSLYASNSDGTKSSTVRTIKNILKVKSQLRHFFILFNHGSGAFQYDRQAFYLELDSNRSVKFLSSSDTNSISGATMISTSAFNPGSGADEQKIQINDNIALSGGVTNLSTVLTSKAADNFAFAPGTASSSSASGVAVTATRYVVRNRPFLKYDNFGNITLDTAGVALQDNYSGVAKEVAFQNDATYGYIAYAKGSNSYVVSTDGTDYFFIRTDKIVRNNNNEDLGSGTYTIGGANLYIEGGANIPFAYKYSYLRDISVSGENELLIEGPTSDESTEIELTGLTQTIAVSSISTPSTYTDGSKITKVRLYRVGGNFSKYYQLADLAVANANTNNASVSKYEDTEYTVEEGYAVPRSNAGVVLSKIMNIIVVNGIYMGSVDSKVHFSEWGNPHSWPDNAVIDLHGAITNMHENNGEAIVFTETSTYRVRGHNFDSMHYIKVPTNQGIPSGNMESLVEYKNSLYFISNEGLCVYANGDISLISMSKFSSFPKISNPRSAWMDDVLYIFAGSGSVNGVKMDLRTGSPVFYRITQNADKGAYYSPRDDNLFLRGNNTSNSGKYTLGSVLSMSYQSGELSFGDAEIKKIFFRFSAVYTSPDSSSTIKWYKGSSLEHTTTLSAQSEPTLVKDEFDDIVVSNSISYKIDGKANIFGLDIIAEPMENFYYPRRFAYADVLYTGAPTIVIKIDGVAKTMTPSTLSNQTLPTSVRMYFPADTTGYISHYVAGGSGDIQVVNYNTENI